MEAYEGNKMDNSSLFNLKHQEFFEDVLLPRLREELHIQRQLIMDSLREHMVRLPDQGTNSASESYSIAQTPCASMAKVGVEDQPHTEKSLSGRIAAPKVDTPDTRQTEGDPPHQEKYSHDSIATPNLDASDILQTQGDESMAVDDSAAIFRPVSALSAASVLAKAAGKKIGIIFHPAHSFQRFQRNGTMAWLHRHLHSSLFRICMSVLISANAIMNGTQTQQEFAAVMKGVEPDNAFIWTISEVIFTSMFSLEILLRVCADGRSFCRGDLGLWNMFDAVLVTQALFSLLSERMSFGLSTQNYSFVRVLRILKFFRVLRVLRVMRNFRSFRVMLISLASSLQSLLWVLFMLAFVLYLFSVFILHCIMASSDDIGPEKQKLYNSYGGLAQTLLSLFMAITGGRDWADLYRPLAALHGSYGLIFVCYIFFSVFGVLNVVTSMFVDSVNSASLSDHYHLLYCEKKRRKQYDKACRAFFSNADKNGSGKLSEKELDEYLQVNRNKAHLATLELEESQAHALYTLLDVDGNTRVDIEEFVQGCAQLKGPAKAIDVSILSNENGKFISQSNHFMDLVQEKLEAIVTKFGISATMEQSPREAHPAKMRFSGKGVLRNDLCKKESDEHKQNVEHTLVEQDTCMPPRTLDSTIPDAVPNCTPTAPVNLFSL